LTYRCACAVLHIGVLWYAYKQTIVRAAKIVQITSTAYKCRKTSIPHFYIGIGRRSQVCIFHITRTNAIVCLLPNAMRNEVSM